MAFSISTLITNLMLWRLVGFMSSIVGFTCLAHTPFFHDLIGEWTTMNIFIYSVACCSVSMLMLLMKSCRLEILKNFLLKGHLVFATMVLTSLHSIWEDPCEENKDEDWFGRVMNLGAIAAFAIMALSFSRILQLGYELGIFNFFLGCFLAMVMKMNFILAIFAAFFCYAPVTIRSFSDYTLQMRQNFPN